MLLSFFIRRKPHQFFIIFLLSTYGTLSGCVEYQTPPASSNYYELSQLHGNTIKAERYRNRKSEPLPKRRTDFRWEYKENTNDQGIVHKQAILSDQQENAHYKVIVSCASSLSITYFAQSNVKGNEIDNFVMEYPDLTFDRRSNYSQDFGIGVIADDHKPWLLKEGYVQSRSAFPAFIAASVYNPSQTILERIKFARDLTFAFQVGKDTRIIHKFSPITTQNVVIGVMSRCGR
ncbi:hypothetical protein [Hyphococcus sp.]|uniref:hypothetical protein n=1 Tax=Hyphococcus sp. TaxID=2038636 RepID=UPI0035C6B63D